MVDPSFRPVDSMRIILALSCLLMIAPALAQSDSVIVGSAGREGRVLIDPGTGQTRVLPALLDPWQFGAIKLHAPRKAKAAKMVEAAPTELPPAEVTPRKHRTPKPAEAVASLPEKPRRVASVAPSPPPSAPSSGLSGFDDLETLTAAPKQVEAAKPAQQRAAAPNPVIAKASPPPAITKPVAEAKPVEAKPVKKASLEPSKPRASSGKARDVITFAPNASDPSGSAVSGVRALAGSLASTLNDGNSRIQLMAYAGMRGEKSSDTRRLSLKRALVVRQLLIDDGIPAERIDVFALGGTEDDGPLDRVDVVVKG